MLPGVGSKLKDVEVDERQFDRVQAIIYSMTPEERAKPELINPSRKRRIAAGCGMQVEDVNKLLAQHKQIKLFINFLEENQMAVKIRLRRMGAKRAPFYRVVVADSKSPRDGKFIEEIGTYDPMKNPAAINIDVEKAQQWIKNGAQPTDTAKALLKQCGAIK